MSDDTLIQVERLSRRFGRQLAVNDVSFELDRGEVLGFLGPNGAGKSTTMRMLTGNLAPSAGRVFINGIDLADEPRRAKAMIGYLPERPPLYREFTVDEYLAFCARLHGISRDGRAAAIRRTSERCGLEGTGRRLIGNLSKGFQQRVGIAQAILHTPEVVILDEPTVGLDPIQIRQIRELIAELGSDHSVILSTHILPEVQATCSRVQIIHEGVLVFSDTLADLDARSETMAVTVGLGEPPDKDELSGLPGVTQVDALGNSRFRLSLESGAGTAPIGEACVKAGWGLEELTPERLTLEQIFVQLTTRDEADDESDREAA